MFLSAQQEMDLQALHLLNARRKHSTLEKVTVQDLHPCPKFSVVTKKPIPLGSLPLLQEHANKLVRRPRP
jgi:hypothetical protein